MKIVIFGLTVTSSWGNGHATLWRGLCRSLARRGHSIVFFEKEVPYYSTQRDLRVLSGCWLHMYRDWEEARPVAKRECANADVAIVTSFCPDGGAACDVVLSSSAQVKTFYDMDTPVTLDKVARGEEVFYLPKNGFADFDLVLSYTGGPRLEAELRTRLRAKKIVPLYGCVDPEVHHRTAEVAEMRADLSYLGTYAADRQQGVEQLLIEPARRLPQRVFFIAGAQYPQDFSWIPNIRFKSHLPPPQHSAFYSSSRLTLNVTRKAMAEMGYCPSGRFFEAAACGTPVLSDWWEGIDMFYEPGAEVLIARTTQDAIAAIELSDGELQRIGEAARERTMAEHTADHRGREFERAVETAQRSVAPCGDWPAVMQCAAGAESMRMI